MPVASNRGGKRGRVPVASNRGGKRGRVRSEV